MSSPGSSMSMARYTQQHRPGSHVEQQRGQQGARGPCGRRCVPEMAQGWSESPLRMGRLRLLLALRRLTLAPSCCPWRASRGRKESWPPLCPPPSPASRERAAPVSASSRRLGVHSALHSGSVLSNPTPPSPLRYAQVTMFELLRSLSALSF